jgi:hypothetical protein
MRSNKQDWPVLKAINTRKNTYIDHIFTQNHLVKISQGFGGNGLVHKYLIMYNKSSGSKMYIRDSHIMLD